MLFSLKLENSSGNIVNLHDEINYSVVEITGLNPPPASLFLGKSPNRKGAKKNGSTLDERNLVIRIKVKGDVEYNRNALYSWIDTESELKIYYQNGVKNVYCEGTVTDCDFSLFTESQIISVAITCPDSYLKELNAIITEISALLKQFTIPFSIDAGGVPFSTIRENNTTNIFNSGSETGVKITIKCNGTVENLSLFDANDTTRIFTIKTTLLKDWIVIIDTESSPKTVKLYKPDGAVENIMKYLAPRPTWFTLKKGNNLFGYLAENGIADAEITFAYENKYLGV